MSELPPQAPPKPKRKSAQDIAMEAAGRQFEDFAQALEKTINSYYGSSEIRFTCKPGGWYIDLENITVNADPRFFLERGYSESEALFATFHEAEHFRDMIQNPEEYKRSFDYFKTRTDVYPAYPKALARLYNCIDDILVNKVVMTRWAAGSKVKSALYPKLFPSSNLRMAGEPPKEQPYHRQFMYALLREAMLPDEVCDVSPEVRAEIDAFQARLGRVKTLEFLTAVNPKTQAAHNDAEERYNFMRFALEPIFERLFRLDMENKRNQDDDNNKKPGQGEGEGEFGDDPFEDGIPDPMDPDELFDQAQKINEKLSQKKDDAFKKAMGVEKKDFMAYQKDFKKIEKYIAQLSEVFNRVIDRRKTYRRKLRKKVKEGPMLDSRLVATGYAEIQAGNDDPTIMLDYEKKEQMRNMPQGLEFTIVCDGSGSVTTDSTRMRLERQLAVLAMEAFAEFRNRIEKEKRKGERIELDIQTETRVFADKDTVVQPLSNKFDHTSRVRLHKTLSSLPGGYNDEPKTFDAIRREQFDRERCERLAKGELKKIIIFLTDGETDEKAVQQKIKELQRLAGEGPDRGSNLVIGGIGFAGGESAIKTYSPNGFYARSFDEISDIFIKIVENILEDV